MLQVTVHVTGLDNAQARLRSLGDSFKDFTDALTSLATQLIAFYEDTVFVSAGQALDTPWVALAPGTVDEKDKNWPGRGILVRTGTLQHGFTKDITPDSLFISNDTPYFPYHQLGTATGPGRGHNIPARPMLGINATVESMIKVAIEADVRAKIDLTSAT